MKDDNMARSGWAGQGESRRGTAGRGEARQGKELEMTTNEKAAVVEATFCDWRTVRTRKTLQLIFEVEIEATENVLAVLGAPLPHKTTWVAIARLKTENNSSE